MIVLFRKLFEEIIITVDFDDLGSIVILEIYLQNFENIRDGLLLFEKTVFKCS